jgi:hypothetical protein
MMNSTRMLLLMIYGMFSLTSILNIGVKCRNDTILPRKYTNSCLIYPIMADTFGSSFCEMSGMFFISKLLFSNNPECIITLIFLNFYILASNLFSTHLQKNDKIHISIGFVIQLLKTSCLISVYPNIKEKVYWSYFKLFGSNMVLVRIYMVSKN